VLKVINPAFDEHTLVEDSKFDKNNPMNDPLLSVAADEAHTITGEYIDSVTGQPWSTFNSLRRAFRRLRRLPVWSIFLSTTGKFYQFAPPSHLDKSGRILNGTLVNVTPFSALGFDHLAEKFRSDGRLTLEHVSSLRVRLSFGRPL
jgi:hypothetical protein